MELCLLGPLLVRKGRITLPTLPPKQRVLLAALLLKPNCPVLLGELAEVMWGPVPPPTALGTLRNHVKDLRKALAGLGESRLGTVPGGYQFEVRAGELDVARFEGLVAGAQISATAGVWEEAAAGLRAGLLLWRAEPLADVPSEWLAAREVPRLAELRLRAVEARIEADLHMGRHEQVIGELFRLTAVHPFRERLHGQLMLALYRDGQQAESLAAYHRVREVLLTELGVEPGPHLRLLLQRILNADPALSPGPPESLWSAPGVTSASQLGLAPVPHQLPASARYFTGRSAEMRALTDMLRDADGGERAAAVCALTGAAGVGKTATAVSWAHQMADRFPDGQLYVDLRGYDPQEPLPATQALAGFIRGLGAAGQDMPSTVAERAALYRSLLSGRRVLVLMDNACSAEQVRPLLPGTAGCAAVVTSRDALASLVARDGAQRVELSALSLDEAAGLLCALIGDRATADDAAVRALASQCSCLPFALRVVAELAAARPAEPLAGLVSELADQRTRLDRLEAGADARTAVRTVLSWSCRCLDGAAARGFRLLGLHPGGGFGPYTVAALTGSCVQDARRVLDTLARASLIQPGGAGRHTMHELFKVYAAEQAAIHDAEPATGAAVVRLLDYYLHSAYAAVRLLKPSFDSPALGPPGPGVTIPVMATRAEAMSWAEAEHPALHAAIGQAATSGLGGHAWQLARLLAVILVLRGSQPESIEVLRTALAAAECADDQAGRAQIARDLGQALVVAGRAGQAGLVRH